jgi:hypothetical protein
VRRQEQNVLSCPPRQSTARTKLRWSSLVHLSLGTLDLLYRLVVAAPFLPPPPAPPISPTRARLAAGELSDLLLPYQSVASPLDLPWCHCHTVW